MTFSLAFHLPPSVNQSVTLFNIIVSVFVLSCHLKPVTWSDKFFSFFWNIFEEDIVPADVAEEEDMESRSVRAGWCACHSPSRKRITKMSKKSQRRKSQVARRMVTCRCQDNLAHMCSTVFIRRCLNAFVFHASQNLWKGNLLQRPTQSPHARHREPRRQLQLAIERRLGRFGMETSFPKVRCDFNQLELWQGSRMEAKAGLCLAVLFVPLFW